MFELVRTPGYNSWQGERWQFCCQRPMVFIGEWAEDDYNRHAPDGDGRAFFLTVVADAVPGMWEDGIGYRFANYIFRCSSCGRFRGHYDMD